jgi:hypothetical protein
VSTVGTERFSVDAGGDVSVRTGQFILSGNSSAISFSTNNTNGAATTRTNLGLGWSALTNSNAANVLLGYTTNFGGVVMPSSLTFGSNVTFSQSIFAATNGVSAGGTLFAGSGSTISFYQAEDQARWRTNLGLGATWLTNTNVTNFRTAIELGSAATNNASAFQPASANLTNLASNNAANLTNFPTLNQNTTGTASNVTGVVALANGGTGATNASNARTALGLGATNSVTSGRANIGTTDGTLLWFGLPAQLSVEGTGGRHAIIANAPVGGGAAVIGESSSGAAAGKFYQDTTYTSPALSVVRQQSSTNSPTLGVGSLSTGSTNAKAVSVSHGATEVFFVRHDGAVSSLYQRFGSGTPQGVVSAPVGAVYHRTDGGTGTSFYVKESGTGNTGWVAK